jgi:hypothetical protein
MVKNLIPLPSRHPEFSISLSGSCAKADWMDIKTALGYELYHVWSSTGQNNSGLISGSRAMIENSSFPA